jgi:hypothetical protein
MTDIDGTGTAEAAALSPVETATAGLETLSADKAWQSDFNGDNGRSAQLSAVKFKSNVVHAAFNPEVDTAFVLLDQMADGLEAFDAVSRAAAEAMIPATSTNDFAFKWEVAADMKISGLQNLNTLAKEIAFAVNANPHFARATIEMIDHQLSKLDGSYAPTNDVDLTDHLRAQLGNQADATLQSALAAFQKMPPDSQAWFQNRVRLPAS